MSCLARPATTDEERRLLTEALDRYRRKGIVHWAMVCEDRLTELDQLDGGLG